MCSCFVVVVLVIASKTRPDVILVVPVAIVGDGQQPRTMVQQFLARGPPQPVAHALQPLPSHAPLPYAYSQLTGI